MIKRIKDAKERAGGKYIRLFVAVLAIIICTATTVAAAANLVTAYVFCDGDMIKVVTFSEDVDDIINKAGVTLNENDLVDMTSYNEGEDDGVIYVYRACEVKVVDGKKTCFVNTAGTVASAVEKAGITLGNGDSLNYDKELYVFDGMIIRVNRAFGVTVIADGKSQSYNVTGGTVADILKKAKITLGKDDTVSVKKTAKVKEGMKITVHRVSYSERKEDETLRYGTVRQKDPSMYKDQSKVIREGVNGKKTVTYRDKFVDGELVESKVFCTLITQQATDRIIAVGTKSRPVINVNGKKTISEFAPPSSLKFDKNGRPVTYKKLLTGKATAYYGGTTCSTGVKVKPGYVAVNPKQIPYGTKMYIVSSDGKFVYGYAIAADTGGFAYNGSGTLIDLYMRTYGDCCKFGRRTVEVYILE